MASASDQNPGANQKSLGAHSKIPSTSLELLLLEFLGLIAVFALFHTSENIQGNPIGLGVS